jgi:hypothetical protein
MADEQRNPQGADQERPIPKTADRSERGAPEHAGTPLPEMDPESDTMRPHGDKLRDRADGDDAQRDVLP